jgi:hypothetical protein
VGNENVNVATTVGQVGSNTANSTDFQNGSLIMITIKQTTGSKNCAQKGHLRDSRKKQRPTSRGKRNSLINFNLTVVNLMREKIIQPAHPDSSRLRNMFTVSLLLVFVG